ncbi:MAG: hypothetical protein WA110_04835 [Anaerolineaceae bacterium]
MKSISGEYLRYIMGHFNITGNELAKALNVDCSLISKWRNEKRHLCIDSPLFQSLVEYIIANDAKYNYTNVKLLLSDSYSNTSSMGPKELCSLLSEQLSNFPDVQVRNEVALGLQQSPYVNHETYYLFTGNLGKLEAIKNVMGIASGPIAPPIQERGTSEIDPLHHFQDKEMMIVMYDTGFWQQSDGEQFIDQWQDMMRTYVLHGGIVRLIRTGLRHSADLAGLTFFWLPLYLKNNVTEYASSLYNPSPINYSVMMLKDQVFLVDLSQRDMNLPYSTTALFLDKQSVGTVQFTFERMFNTSNPVYTRYQPSESKQLKQFLIESLTPSTDVYFKSFFPPIGVFSLRLIRQILEYNDLDPQTTSLFMHFFQGFHDTYSRNLSHNSFRFFLDWNAMKDYLKEEQSTFTLLSLIVGKPIEISRELMIAAYYDLIQSLRVHPNLQICLLDSKPFKNLDRTVVMVAENTGTLVYDYSESVACTTKMAVQTGACYNQFDKIFNQTAGDEKNKFRLTRLIEETLAEFQS